MNETDSPDSKVGRFSEKVSRKDPLAILGLVILFIGVALIVYGFIPISQANYVQIASGPVPLTDASGNFITSPESYFQEHYTGTGSIDRVDCSPSVNGYYCYGFEFVGTVIKYSQAAKEYGAGILALGFVAIFVSSRLSPVEPNAKNHTRPITIRIDEDICISNGVCVGLAPSVFQLKKQDFPTIFAPLAYVVDPYGADNDTIIEAARMCPTGAIIIEDAETGERIHPSPPKD